MIYLLFLIILILLIFLKFLKTKEHFFNNIEKVQIFGERCSGTNYLQNLLLKNFDVSVTWECGFKHFFGFDEDKYNDKILFICIVRNPVDWINILYIKKWHLPNDLKKKDNFLNKEFYSINDESSDSKDYSEIMKDRNIYTNERYKNIFELRHTKNKYLIDDLPKKVKNYLFIRYEDLINDFDNTMYKIKNKNLKLKKNIKFPENIVKKDVKFKLNKKENNYLITKTEILNNVNFNNEYELKLNYLEPIKIGFIIPTTSNKKNYKTIGEIDFFKIVMESLKKQLNNEYIYKFYLGYDDDDIFYNKNKNNIIDYFNNLKLKNTSIKLIKIKNKKGRVGSIWSDLAELALNDDCEYLYQIGDDIKFLTSNWESIFIDKLRTQNNIGVVGPKDPNHYALTQSFVHKTHLKIFKRYFPEELKNWYIDDWITNVYKPNYSFKFDNISIQNSGGEQRYKITNNKELYLKILKRDKKYLINVLKNTH